MSVKGPHITNFITKKILKRKRNTKIILDNARTHHNLVLKKIMNKGTNKLVFNIPYHPQTMMIFFSKKIIESN